MVQQAPPQPFTWDVMPEASEKAPFILLVEAQQGQGKTHLAYTFPQPIYHLDTESRGDKVGAKFRSIGVETYWKACRTFGDIRRTITELIFPHFTSGTIVIDSGSDLQTYAEMEYLVETKKRKDLPKCSLEQGLYENR